MSSKRKRLFGLRRSIVSMVLFWRALEGTRFGCFYDFRTAIWRFFFLSWRMDGSGVFSHGRYEAFLLSKGKSWCVDNLTMLAYGRNIWNYRQSIVRLLVTPTRGLLKEGSCKASCSYLSIADDK